MDTWVICSIRILCLLLFECTTIHADCFLQQFILELAINLGQVHVLVLQLLVLHLPTPIFNL